MKKILSLAVLLSGISFATLAQEAPKTTKSEVKKEVRGDRKESGKKHKADQTPEEFAKSRTERLDKKVKLSDKQRKEVEAIFLAEAKESKPASKEEGMKRKEASMAKLNSVLTTEQQTILKEAKGKDRTEKSKYESGDKGHSKKADNKATK